jgi:hypothetical protein
MPIRETASEPGARLGQHHPSVITKGVSPEQAVNEAIARIKQILNE